MMPDQQKRIIEQCAMFDELFAQGNIGDMVDRFYHADAVMEGRGLSMLCGREAIQRLFQEVRARYQSITIMPDPVSFHGTLAYGTFTNHNTLNDGYLEIHRGIMIWIFEAGSWRVKRDFFYSQNDRFEQDLLLDWDDTILSGSI